MQRSKVLAAGPLAAVAGVQPTSFSSIITTQRSDQADAVLVGIALVVGKASSRDELAVCFVVTEQPSHFVLCLPFELGYGYAYVAGDSVQRHATSCSEKGTVSCRTLGRNVPLLRNVTHNLWTNDVHDLASCCVPIRCSEQIIIRARIHTSNATAIYFLTNAVCQKFQSCCMRFSHCWAMYWCSCDIEVVTSQWHFLVGFQISKVLFSGDFEEYCKQFTYTV